MYSDEAVLGLIDSIYAAAADPGKWGQFLQELCDEMTSRTAVLVAQVENAHCCKLELHYGLDPDAHRQYQSYYGTIDAFQTAAQQAGFNHPGVIVPALAFVTDTELLNTEYCNDFLLKFDIFRHCFALLGNDDAAPTVLSLMRGRHERPFDVEELELLRFLAPHLQRAIQLQNRIQGLERRGDAAADVLDQLRQGVVLLDAKGNVLLVNQAAKTILSGERALRLTCRGLVAAIPSENRRLSALIQGAIDTGCRLGLHSGGAMQISRYGSRRPLQVLVTPLRTKSIYLGKDVPVAAIFVSDPECTALCDPTFYAQLFGLTGAEARLAEILASGINLKDAADQLGLALSTLRSQLKSIFAKTNTNRQSELVRLLLLTLTQSSQTRTVLSGNEL
jgi:DNA-binding CsgD family transcriptional regulator/PAS domain-containing protein